jgi:hypothetical protein
MSANSLHLDDLSQKLHAFLEWCTTKGISIDSRVDIRPVEPVSDSLGVFARFPIPAGSSCRPHFGFLRLRGFLRVISGKNSKEINSICSEF